MTRASTRLRKISFLARNNPGLLAELGWRRVARRRPSSGTVEGRVGDVTFSFELDLDPDVRAMWHRRYEVPIVRLMRRYLPRGGTFVDVGANIGYISANAAALVGPTGRVVALEPVNRYFQRLRRLAEQNPSHRIETIRVAAGAVVGRATIRISDADNIGYNSLTPNWVGDDVLGDVEEVDVAPLDQILPAHAVDRVDLLKIDTEGFEIPVLEGASDVLDRFRPTVLLEVTASAARNHGKSLEYLATLVDDLGYTVHAVEAPSVSVDLAAVEGRVDVLLLRR